MRKTHRPLTVVALMSSVFMAAMEVTVVSTAMPTVVGDLGGVDLYAWVFAAYVLAATVGMPIYGKVADLYGRRPVLLLGISLFLAGSIACGLTPSMHWLIAFRVLQGLGGGAMQSMALTIVGDIFTLHERARMQGVIGGVWGVAGLVGPLLGGFIVARLGWRWVFFVSVPFGLTAMVLLRLFLHEHVEPVRGRRLDVLGALLIGAVVASLLIGARGTFGRFPVLLAVALFGAFLVVERRAPEPVLPLSLFSERVMAVASAAGGIVGGALMATLTFVPLFVQGVLGGTPTQAGAAIAPMAIGWPVASALGGRLIPRLGFRPLVRVGLLVAAGGSLALAALVSVDASTTLPRVTTALFGIGMGFANTALLIAVQTSVSWKQRGVATASTMLFRTIGGALSVGILGELLAARLASRPDLAAHADELLAGPVHGHGLGADKARALAELLASGLGSVFWVIAGLGVAAFVVGLAFPKVVVEPERKPGLQESD